MPRTMPAAPSFLRVDSSGPAIGVDREKLTIRGYVVAQAGVFKDRRGEFDERSLAMIVEQGNAAPKGLKSRFTHPSLSEDGLGNYLGRASSFRLDSVAATVDGKPGRIPAVRADLALADAARKSPKGDLVEYVLALAEQDPDAFSSSLVLRTKKIVRLNDDGTPKTDAAGRQLPPIWHPEALHASDVVDTGAAVDGFLSVDGETFSVSIDDLPDALQRQGWAMLDRLFSGQPRDVTEARLRAFADRYLAHRYGGALAETPALAAWQTELLGRIDAARA